MLTLGVDLAAVDERTATASVEWSTRLAGAVNQTASARAATRAVRAPARQHSTQWTGGSPAANGTIASVGRAK